MHGSVSSLKECVTFYLQDEILSVLLHPHLNILFWATHHGVIGAYDFQNEAQNYYPNHTFEIQKCALINDNFM